MKIAVTDHAVDRYRERVQGAENLEDESVRDVIREKVQQGFKEGLVRPHPTEVERRVIPFKAGPSVLYFAVGPNKTSFPADWAVISVLYDKEVGGKKEIDVTVGDVAPSLKGFKIDPPKPPRYLIVIGPSPHIGDVTQTIIEQYQVKDEQELEALLDRRRPTLDEVFVYEYRPLEIKTRYIVEKKLPK
jgi:hypothetical protein